MCDVFLVASDTCVWTWQHTTYHKVMCGDVSLTMVLADGTITTTTLSSVSLWPVIPLWHSKFATCKWWSVFGFFSAEGTCKADQRDCHTVLQASWGRRIPVVAMWSLYWRHGCQRTAGRCQEVSLYYYHRKLTCRCSCRHWCLQRLLGISSFLTLNCTLVTLRQYKQNWYSGLPHLTKMPMPSRF